SKSLTVLTRSDEGFDHLRVNKVAIELIQLRQPKVVTSVIRVRRIVRVPSQVTNILQQHKRPVELLSIQDRILSYSPQGPRPGRHIAGVSRRTKLRNRCVAIRGRSRHAGIRTALITKRTT